MSFQETSQSEHIICSEITGEIMANEEILHIAKTAAYELWYDMVCKGFGKGNLWVFEEKERNREYWIYIIDQKTDLNNMICDGYEVLFSIKENYTSLFQFQLHYPVCFL